MLLLVAVIGALAATAFDRLRLSTRLAANFAAAEQARGIMLGVEDLVLLTIDERLALGRDRTTLAGEWNGATRRISVAGGFADVTIRDGGNCFNLNSVIQGGNGTPTVARPLGIAQFAVLVMLSGVPQGEAERIASAAADWADSDEHPLPNGAEDAAYLQGNKPYRTGNGPFAETSELRSVAGVTAEIYGRIRPLLCTLPQAELTQFNINTLTMEQAPLIAMLAPGQIDLESARQVIARRPAAGWTNLIDFWRIEALSELDLPSEAQLQPQLRTTWFAALIKAEIGGVELIETALIDGRGAPARLAVRRFGNDE